MHPPHRAFGAVSILVLVFANCGPGVEIVIPAPNAHAEKRREFVESFTRVEEARITDKRVSAAMLATPWHRFAPEEVETQELKP